MATVNHDTQASSHLDEYKKAMTSAVKRTFEYAARTLEEADAVIAKNIQGANSFAVWQLIVVREV